MKENKFMVALCAVVASFSLSMNALANPLVVDDPPLVLSPTTNKLENSARIDQAVSNVVVGIGELQSLMEANSPKKSGATNISIYRMGKLYSFSIGKKARYISSLRLDGFDCYTDDQYLLNGRIVTGSGLRGELAKVIFAGGRQKTPELIVACCLKVGSKKLIRSRRWVFEDDDDDEQADF